MRVDRPTRPGKPKDDDWVPPAWNNPPMVENIGTTGRRAASVGRNRTERRPRPETIMPPVATMQKATYASVRSAVRLEEGGLVLGLAIAPAIVGFASLFMSVVPFLSGGGNLPLGLILVLAMQCGMVVLLNLSERSPLLTSWTTTIVCSAVLLPLLALQVALLREPYVSWARQSASPAVVATVVVGMIVIAGAVWSVASNWEHPDEAGLIFMPQALMVPALIGMHSTIMQQSALRMLGIVLVLAAFATGMSWLLAPSERLFVPPGAVVVEVVGLLVSGHGPSFPSTSGDIVRLLYFVMLALSVVLVVAVPLAAIWVSHGAVRVDELHNEQRRAAPSPRSASRGPIISRQ